MAHSGPFRCQCGQIHFDTFDGPSNDLLPYIDLDGVAALNATERGAARTIFKPYDQRLDRESCLESEEDDPQLLIHIPFTCPVKIKSLTCIGGSDGLAPSVLRAYINHEALDIGDAEQTRPVQEWTLAEDPLGAIEYPTQFSKFQNVSRLSLLVNDNHGGDHTLIHYLGLSGVGTAHKRQAVVCVYESRGVGNLNDPMKEDAAGQAKMGM